MKQLYIESLKKDIESLTQQIKANTPTVTYLTHNIRSREAVILRREYLEEVKRVEEDPNYKPWELAEQDRQSFLAEREYY